MVCRTLTVPESDEPSDPSPGFPGSPDTNITIESVSVFPDKVEPGNVFDVTVTLGNTGQTDSADIIYGIKSPEFGSRNIAQETVQVPQGGTQTTATFSYSDLDSVSATPQPGSVYGAKPTAQIGTQEVESDTPITIGQSVSDPIEDIPDRWFDITGPYHISQSTSPGRAEFTYGFTNDSDETRQIEIDWSLTVDGQRVDGNAAESKFAYPNQETTVTVSVTSEQPAEATLCIEPAYK